MEAECELDSQGGMGEKTEKPGGRNERGRGEEKENGRDGGKSVPAGLEMVEQKEYGEEGYGKEQPTWPRAANEGQGGECRKGREERNKEHAQIGEALGNAQGAERNEFRNMAGVEAEHERRAGNIPFRGAEEDESGEGGGCGQGKDGVKKKHGGKTLFLVP